MEKKVCSKEGVEKPIEEFHKDVSSSDGYSSSCARCRNAARKKRGRKHRYRPDRTKVPVETQKPMEQREKEALAKCHMKAYKALREMYPQTFDTLLKKELKNNPIMIARKWRELPETEGV